MPCTTVGGPKVSIAAFLRAADTHPSQVALPLPVLADLLAPEHPPTRADLRVATACAQGELDAAWAAWRGGTRSDDRLCQAIEVAAHRHGATEAPAADLEIIAEECYLSLRHGVAQTVKGGLAAWSATVYKDGGKRRDADVVALTAITFDFDSGATLDDAVAPWNGHPLLAHTTWSHTEAHPKFRLILPLAEPVPVAAWPRVWRWAFGRAPGADVKCSNPSRMYYLPAVQWEGAPYRALVRDLDRPLLAVDWRALPDPLPAPQPPRVLPTVRLPRDQAERLQRQRLRSDPSTRERAGACLGARQAGGGQQARIERVTCPACGRPSVWWWVQPDRASRAQCHHRQSCGWNGDLFELLQRHGGPDV